LPQRVHHSATTCLLPIPLHFAPSRRSTCGLLPIQAPGPAAPGAHAVPGHTPLPCYQPCCGRAPCHLGPPYPGTPCYASHTALGHFEPSYLLNTLDAFTARRCNMQLQLPALPNLPPAPHATPTHLFPRPRHFPAARPRHPGCPHPSPPPYYRWDILPLDNTYRTLHATRCLPCAWT